MEAGAEKSLVCFLPVSVLDVRVLLCLAGSRGAAG